MKIPLSKSLHHNKSKLALCSRIFFIETRETVNSMRYMQIYSRTCVIRGVGKGGRTTQLRNFITQKGSFDYKTHPTTNNLVIDNLYITSL